MTPIGRILLRDSQFRLQDMREIYTTGNGLYNNIVHKILVKGKQGLAPTLLLVLTPSSPYFNLSP